MVAYMKVLTARVIDFRIPDHFSCLARLTATYFVVVLTALYN